MRNIEDLTGKRYGKLVVIKKHGKNKNNKTIWECYCNCTNTTYLLSGTLKAGLAKSCGCSQGSGATEISKNKIAKIIGKKYNKLTILEYSHSTKYRAIIKCSCDCGRECYKTATQVINGKVKSCGKCHLLVKEYPEIASEFDLDKNKNININDIVSSSKKKLWWICPLCNNTYKAIVGDRTLKKSGCPVCRQSHGEKRVDKILIKYNIRFEREKRFNNCKNERCLPFDFYLLDYNTCIEYDGSQHYSKEGHWKIDDEEFGKIKLRDNIKTEFCYKNNIKLIRISYLDIDNIEKIIIEELNLAHKS